MGPHETAKPQRKALGRPGRQPGRRRAVLRAQDGGGAVSAQPAAQLGTSPCTRAAAFAELQSPQQTGRLKARGPQPRNWTTAARYLLPRSPAAALATSRFLAMTASR